MNLQSQMLSAERHFRNQMDDIPTEFIARATGLVFITTIKGAFIWSAALSTGMVTKRLPSGQWSPPISVAMGSAGFGLQAGLEKIDIIMILESDEEIRTFESSGQLRLGTSFGLTAGPIGRDLDVSAYIGRKGVSCNLYYAHSIGAYGGVSLEGAVILSRWAANRSFYGESVKVKDVLAGKVSIPVEKQVAVEEFQQFLFNYENGRMGARIVAGSSSSGNKNLRPPLTPASARSVPQAQQEGTLLDFSDVGLLGKDLLRTSLETPEVSVVFTADHIVDEDDPAFKNYNIIGALKDDTALVLEGTVENGMKDPLRDFVRVRINQGGVLREGLVSRYVLKKI